MTTMEVDDSSDSKQSFNSENEPREKVGSGSKHVIRPGRKRDTDSVVKEEINKDSSETRMLEKRNSTLKRRRLVAGAHQSAAMITTTGTASEGSVEPNSGSVNGHNNTTPRVSELSISRSDGEAAQVRLVTKQTAVDRVEATIRMRARTTDERSTNCERHHTVHSSEDAKQAAQRHRESGTKRRSGGASKPFTTLLPHAPRTVNNI